jgi:hypothetical protein
MRSSTLLTVAMATALLAGCAEGALGYEYGPGPVADVEYDGYYDGYYGPIYDGYWGDDGVFFYRSSREGGYRRGDVTHFRHEATPGFGHIHGVAHPAPAKPKQPG